MGCSGKNEQSQGTAEVEGFISKLWRAACSLLKLDGDSGEGGSHGLHRHADFRHADFKAVKNLSPIGPNKASCSWGHGEF